MTYQRDVRAERPISVRRALLLLRGRWLRWAMLALGTASVLMIGLNLLILSAVLKRFGGFHWSWDLLRRNADWAVLFVFGLIMLAASLREFLRHRRRGH